MNRPKLMLLDEPMNGLDPEGIAELRDLLIDLNQKEGITVLISSHILSELEKIASCYGFISKGKIIEEITAEELQQKCRKCIDIKVSDVPTAEKVLKDLGLDDYKASSNGEIKIFNDVDVNKLMSALVTNKVNVLTFNSSEESVEDYYLGLIKEAK